MLEETNRHDRTAIEVVGKANETIVHISNGLFKVVAPALKKEIALLVEAEVTGHSTDGNEGK